jgi:hypothetical protein
MPLLAQTRLSIASLASLASIASIASIVSIASIALTVVAAIPVQIMPAAVAATTSVRQETASPGPGPRSGHSLVYDPVRKRLVAIDGYLPPHDSSPGELWTWDGHRWALVPGSGSGPSKRIVGSAAFDTRRNRIVSFGGSHSTRGTLGDTWEWNGTAWQEIADTRIGRRDHHVLTYDEARGKTILFGGNAGPSPWPTDTWEWDGLSWKQVAVEGPVGRSRTSMVYDGARKELVLFGGAGVPPGPKEPLVIFDDTWVWNGANAAGWRKMSGPSPPARYAHAMAFDSRRNIIVMYGGAQMTADRQTAHLEDMWQWDGRRWTEIKLTGRTPGKRYSPAMAFDPSRNRIVLSGGLEVKGRGEFTAFDDVWEWDGASWTPMK